MDKIGIDVVEEVDIDEYKTVFILDTATIEQLEEFREVVKSSKIPKIIVDHHTPHPFTLALAKLSFIDEYVSSTCEIVYKLWEACGYKPQFSVARVLLIGIAFDTRRFILGDAGTFKAVSDLLDIAGPIEVVINSLNTPFSCSEIIARIKAAQRMKFHQFNNWIVVSSHISSFQSSSARALIGLGADVAFIVGEESGLIRASLRSTERFHADTSIHLGRDLALSLGEEFGGAGSGHPTAAGINSAGDPNNFLSRALEMLKEKIS